MTGQHVPDIIIDYLAASFCRDWIIEFSFLNILFWEVCRVVKGSIFYLWI